jgi:hypothetical protein
MKEVNYNHLHTMKAHHGLSGVEKGYTLTIGDLRDAIARLPDEAELVFGPCQHGEEVSFYRFKPRGTNLIQIEFQ